MVEEIIQRGIVWTFVIHVWWILKCAKLLSKSAPNGNFGDFLQNILKIFFALFSGFFGGPKGALQHP